MLYYIVGSIVVIAFLFGIYYFGLKIGTQAGFKNGYDLGVYNSKREIKNQITTISDTFLKKNPDRSEKQLRTDMVMQLQNEIANENLLLIEPIGPNKQGLEQFKITLKILNKSIK